MSIWTRERGCARPSARGCECLENARRVALEAVGDLSMGWMTGRYFNILLIIAHRRDIVLGEAVFAIYLQYSYAILRFGYYCGSDTVKYLLLASIAASGASAHVYSI